MLVFLPGYEVLEVIQKVVLNIIDHFVIGDQTLVEISEYELC